MTDYQPKGFLSKALWYLADRLAPGPPPPPSPPPPPYDWEAHLAQVRAMYDPTEDEEFLWGMTSRGAPRKTHRKQPPGLTEQSPLPSNAAAELRKLYVPIGRLTWGEAEIHIERIAKLAKKRGARIPL